VNTRERSLLLVLLAVGAVALGLAATSPAGAAQGSNQVEGVSTVGSSTGLLHPVAFGGKDGAGNAQVAALETSTNCLQVTEGVNLVLEPPTPTGLLTSNGTTPVTIAAATAGKRNILVSGILWNSNGSGVTHNVDLVDTANNSAVLMRIPLVAASGYDFSQHPGVIQTRGGGALVFKIDSGGSSNDVTGTLGYVQK
jgi:hypothetical protein